jgi:HEAT repeat protein
MFAKCPSKLVFWFFFCALLSNISIAADAKNTSPGRRPPCSSEEKMFLRELGLREDVNDAEIIQLLDIPNPKRLFVTSLVTYRKIYSAMPKLLQIVNEDEAIAFDRVAAAEVLCDFGNKEWIETIKTLSLDPNSMIARTSLRFAVAGLLARAGDYSQFEIVAAAVSDSKHYVRFSGICELANFRDKTAPVTDLAVELLLSAATADPEPRLRQVAIYSLEKIAKEKPQIIPKLIDALEANKHSVDKYLGISSRVKLKIYGLKRAEEESKQP